MSLISLLLHEWTFGAALISTGTFILIKQRHLHASLALMFFIAGWFVTEIPLLSELTITTPQKYIAQAMVSLCLVALYSSLSGSLPLLIASVNELLLIAINIAFLMGEYHPWKHWFLYGVINYISLVALLYNYWQRGRVGNRESGSVHYPFKAWMHARGRIILHNKKAPAMAKTK